MERRFFIFAVAFVASGCAFGTNRVRLPATAAVPIPDRGASMAVRVKDARPEVAGAQVGFKRNGYGAKTGSVELDHDEALADVLKRDLVAILRERGYRAQDAQAGSEASDLLVDAEIVNFVIDVKQGFWSGAVEGIAVVRLTILDAPNRRQVLSDIARADYTKSGIQFVSEDDHQEVAENLYRRLLDNIRTAVPDGRAPLQGAAP